MWDERIVSLCKLTDDKSQIDTMTAQDRNQNTERREDPPSEICTLKAKIYDWAFHGCSDFLVWWTYRHLELCPYLIIEVRAAKQTLTSSATVSVTAWDGGGEKTKMIKKGTVDRQRQMSLFGISTKLQRERVAWSHHSVRDKWSESVQAPVPTWAFSLPLQYAELSSGNRKSNN